MAKEAGVLSSVHQGIYPNKLAPIDLDVMAATFKPGSSIMADYWHTQMVRGSELTFQLLLGHQIAGDFDKVASEFPKKPDGKTASLSRVKVEASHLTEKLVTTYKKRVARAVEAATRRGRSMSESAS